MKNHIELIEEMISYIEEHERICDGEWGHCRSHHKILSDGDMPDLYKELNEVIGRTLYEVVIISDDDTHYIDYYSDDEPTKEDVDKIKYDCDLYANGTYYVKEKV